MAGKALKSIGNALSKLRIMAPWRVRLLHTPSIMRGEAITEGRFGIANLLPCENGT
jgi:hypothetical protein